MKNLLTKKPLSEKIAEAIAKIFYELVMIFLGLLNLVGKLLWKFRSFEWKLGVALSTVAILYSSFPYFANAPKSYATQPFQESIIVSLPMHVTPNLSLRQTVLSLVAIEFGKDQVDSFDNIITHESGWDSLAVNPHSGSCGLFQSLPCNRMHSMALEDQIAFGFNYIKARYGTPNKAWAFWKEHNWY